MKTKSLSLVALIMAVLFSMQLMAQKAAQTPKCDNDQFPKKERFLDRLPGITEQQKEEIKKIHLQTMKAQQPLKNEKDELQAKLKTLTTVDQPDTKAVNAVIEKIGSINTEMMKKRISEKLSIRNLLTEEQRIVFDAQSQKMKERRFDRDRRPDKRRAPKRAQNAPNE